MNYEYYTIKDIMSDQWVKKLHETKLKPNMDSSIQFQNEKIRTQS